MSARTYDQPVTRKFVLASDAPNSNPAHKLAFHEFRRCKLFTFNPFCLVITRFLYVLFRANILHWKHVDSYAFLFKSRAVRVAALSTWLFLHQERSYVNVVTKHFDAQRNELNKAQITLCAFVIPISLSIFM